MLCRLDYVDERVRAQSSSYDLPVHFRLDLFIHSKSIDQWSSVSMCTFGFGSINCYIVLHWRIWLITTSNLLETAMEKSGTKNFARTFARNDTDFDTEFCFFIILVKFA